MTIRLTTLILVAVIHYWNILVGSTLNMLCCFKESRFLLITLYLLLFLQVNQLSCIDPLLIYILILIIYGRLLLLFVLRFWSLQLFFHLILILLIEQWRVLSFQLFFIYLFLILNKFKCVLIDFLLPLHFSAFPLHIHL